MSAWDPHLNQTVSIRNVTLNGISQSFFNPYNFTGEPFFLRLFDFEPGSSTPESKKQLFAFHYAAECVLPISGIYCPLNRWLFFVEVFFGLLCLSLSYEWLSVISIAAALNYTAVAAIHAIILVIVGSQRTIYYTYDLQALYEILGTSVLLAHPLQLWSQTLQRRAFTKTRFIIACWCVLVCVAFVLTDRFEFEGLTDVSITQIDSDGNLPEAFGRTLKDATCSGCFNDTINFFLPTITPQTWQDQRGVAQPCPGPDPLFLSPIYKDQTLAPDLFPTNSLTITNSYLRLSSFFSIYAVIKSAATIALAFHGQRSACLVRAKLYLLIRGNGTSRWRPTVGKLAASFYHFIQFLLGIISLPIAIIALVIFEYESAWAPKSEVYTDIGQWGPCAGALLLAFAVMLNTTSAAYIIQSLFVWLLLAPANSIFPTRFKRRHLPRFNLDYRLVERLQGFPRWLGLFFIDEYLSTREWLRKPYEASLDCILEEEEQDGVVKDSGTRKSILTVSGHPV